jgi:hypothetical protein
MTSLHAGGAVATVDRLGGRQGSTLGTLPEGRAASAAGAQHPLIRSPASQDAAASLVGEPDAERGRPWNVCDVRMSTGVPPLDAPTGSRDRSRVSSLDLWLPEAAVAPPPPAASPAAALPQHEVHMPLTTEHIVCRQHACLWQSVCTLWTCQDAGSSCCRHVSLSQ